jgi:hypothetical protein
MKILRNTNDLNLIINGEQFFKNDAGWDDGFNELEKETLKGIINPIENYETMRYIHKPYMSNSGITQTDIWFYFYFLDAMSGYTNGLDYSLIGISNVENSLMLKQSTESFFKLEFFKTPNGEPPDRTNRRLVMSRNLSLPLGEKYLYAPLNGYIHLPVFTGSNYRNKENMYLFWFVDDTAFNETNLTGNTFWMTLKFFNAKDGSILDYTTTGLTAGQEVDEVSDMYYKMVIDRTDYSYEIYKFDGINVGDRVGLRNNPIVFYEKRG